MGWAARAKHRGPGMRNRRVKMTPEALATLLPNLDELEKFLAQVPNDLARQQLRHELTPMIAANMAKQAVGDVLADSRKPAHAQEVPV